MQDVKAVAMGVIASIEYFRSDMANPAITRIEPGLKTTVYCTRALYPYIHTPLYITQHTIGTYVLQHCSMRLVITIPRRVSFWPPIGL
jgi:hypothetical protein